MSINIQGKVALVTGANRGIGRAIVEALIEHGASKVYAAVRNLESLAEMSQQIGSKLVPIQLDLTQPNSITALANAAKDVQVLVNNAGILVPASPLDDNAETALQQELEVNAFGLLRIAQAFAPILAANGGAALVQLNSVASIKTFTGITTYSASKAASYAITQGLRELFAAQGIAVLSVHPGPIATKMAETGGVTEGAEPTSVVAEGIIKALQNGDFLLFPDAFAKEMGLAYQGFAEVVIEPLAESTN